MRTHLLIVSLTAAIPLSGFVSAQDAPAPKPDAEATEPAPEISAQAIADPPAIDLREPEPAKIPESIKKMTDDEKRKLQSLLQDAATFLGGIRVQEAFEKLVDAEAMAPDYAPVHNLKGAAYTKVRNFEKAGSAFAKAVELAPGAFMSRFNLTEIHFVEGKFTQAEKAFSELVASNPEMPKATKALIDFKLIICKLKGSDDVDGAKAILKGYDFLDDYPTFYFGNAAIHFYKDEEQEAKTWMISAEKIYGRNEINIYTDSFIEVGWIENLQ